MRSVCFVLLFPRQQGKKITTVNLVLIDPFYEKLTLVLSGEKLALKTKTEALLIRKSATDLTSFAKAWSFGKSV